MTPTRTERFSNQVCDVNGALDVLPIGRPPFVILFDWDGTIVDSVPSLYRSDAEICRRLGRPFDDELFRRTWSPNWRRKYAMWGFDEAEVKQAEAVWAETFDSGDTIPFEGVPGALNRLAACGYLLGIVTSGSRGEIAPQFERVGLAGVLSVAVYGDEPIEGKPDAAPLLLALVRAGASPADAIYVGDSLDDMRMAMAAGVRGVGVVSMLADEDDLRAAGASETVDSVVEWVDRFLGQEEASSAEAAG
jgi:phosphoglycolate phosphatase